MTDFTVALTGLTGSPMAHGTVVILGVPMGVLLGEVHGIRD